MQRLNRFRDDRGAVAVWVAIFMVPLFLAAALAIDVGAATADRQRLQTGADAAALAIAQECAAGVCGDAAATAQELAGANDPLGGPATGTVIELDESVGRVVVQTDSERDHWFARVIGEETVALTARGAAVWGWPTGASTLPLTFSWCEVIHYTGATEMYDGSGNLIGLEIGDGAENIVLYNKSNRPENFHGCDSAEEPPSVPNGTAPAGGFGWLLETAGGTCAAMETEAGSWYSSDTGNDHPDTCTAADIQAMLGSVVLIPVFDATNGLTGSNAKYHIFGYLAFQFEGYYFGNGWGGSIDGPIPCGNPNRCISGDIVDFVDLDAAADVSPSGPRLGAAVVELRLPEEG